MARMRSPPLLLLLLLSIHCIQCWHGLQLSLQQGVLGRGCMEAPRCPRQLAQQEYMLLPLNHEFCSDAIELRLQCDKRMRHGHRRPSRR